MAEGLFPPQPRDLKHWYDPSTWFKNRVVERDLSEIATQEGVLAAFIAQEGLPSLEWSLKEGRISSRSYDREKRTMYRQLQGIMYELA